MIVNKTITISAQFLTKNDLAKVKDGLVKTIPYKGVKMSGSAVYHPENDMVTLSYGDYEPIPYACAFRSRNVIARMKMMSKM